MGIDQKFLDSLEKRIIGPDIDLAKFDCDGDNGPNSGGINWFLKTCALEHHRKRLSTVTCWLHEENPAGYMTISMGYTEFKDSQWWRKIGLGGIKYTEGGRDAKKFPAMLIGMLGVDKGYRGRGLGKEMVREAITCALEAAPKIGCRIVHVDSLRTEGAIGLYESMGFTMADDQDNRAAPWMYFDLKERPDGK